MKPHPLSQSGAPHRGPFHFVSLLGRSLLSLALACSGAAAVAGPAGVQPVRVVSTPNPNVFPLLVALAETPDLPVTLLPVASGSGIDTAFTANGGEALLSMSFVAAKEVTQGTVPDLQLYQATFWRGFSELAFASQPVASFQDLAGMDLLVSGPVSSGENSGPDILFQAALRRSGIDTTQYQASGNMRDYGIFQVFYLPVMQAANALLNQTPLDDGDGAIANDQPPSAAFMVEPASTGLIMKSISSGQPLVRAIDIQALFTGYPRFPYGELPLGGVSVRASVANDPARGQAVQRFLAAYRAAASELSAAQGHPMAIFGLARSISAGLTQYFGGMGVSLPPAVVAAALANGQLVYRTDLPLAQIQPDLGAWLLELLGTAPPASFYRYD